MSKLREFVEFRIAEEDAAQFLPPGTGVGIGPGVCKVQVSRDDPLFAEIGRLQRQFRASGGFFYLFSAEHRSYSSRELEEAGLFKMLAKRVFEPCGEQCGTVYDDSTACPGCGAGARQVSDLHLDLRKVPTKSDFAETIAGETVISQCMAECMVEAGLRGFELRPVRHKARYQDDPLDLERVPAGREVLRMAEAAGAPHPTWRFWVWLNREENRAVLDRVRKQSVAEAEHRSQSQRERFPTWYQLRATSAPVEITPPTRAGSDPFDESSYGACDRGDLLGLNLLSEVTIKRSSWDDSDIVRTRQFVGVRRGLLRPRQVLLFSPKAWRTIDSAKLKGLVVEVAHLA